LTAQQLWLLDHGDELGEFDDYFQGFIQSVTVSEGPALCSEALTKPGNPNLPGENLGATIQRMLTLYFAADDAPTFELATLLREMGSCHPLMLAACAEENWGELGRTPQGVFGTTRNVSPHAGY